MGFDRSILEDEDLTRARGTDAGVTDYLFDIPVGAVAGLSQAVNPVKSSLIANSSGAKATENSMDFLSNGFKLRTSGNGHNTSGDTYLYMAFAQNPFVNSNGTPSNAH